MLDIHQQLIWLRSRVAELEQQERYDDCDALFAEFCEWFVTGSDADDTVLLVPQPTAWPHSLPQGGLSLCLMISVSDT